MIDVDKIEDIRRRARRGEPIASIARAVGVSEPTARKYARMDDLSPEPPRRRQPESEALAPHEGTIDSWLDDDRGNWRRRRHTAVRAYARLRDGFGYRGSHSTVQRYVRRRREEMARDRDRRNAEGLLTLSWLPGEVQVDFGEADSRVRGVVTRGKYLTVTFPHPDVGLTQAFWGETSECVCQGPRNVFEFAGGVPRRAVLDNATEVGRRVGGEAGPSGPFRRLAAHHGLDHTLANPYSGNVRRATSRTRSDATGGTSSCPSRRSTTSPRSTAGCSGTAPAPARAGATTGSARPSPSCSGRTGTRPRRCRRPRSRA